MNPLNELDNDAKLKILEKVKDGLISPKEALSIISAPPFLSIDFATLDTNRQLRTGFPEVVFCQGKTPSQVVEIIANLYSHHGYVMATRVDKDHLEAIKVNFPDALHFPLARIVIMENKELQNHIQEHKGIAVLSAGTADLHVAEEAAVTAEAMGNSVRRIYDVGVAGIHRLLVHAPSLMDINVCIVAAGMEGALASVVGGLLGKPVIGVPTSVGYGASFNGIASLLGMLNSCAPGVAVVNIDNGFGAGFLAALINLAISKGNVKNKAKAENAER